MPVRKKEIRLPHSGIEHELCAQGHGNFNDPLQQLLAAEESGKLTYPAEQRRQPPPDLKTFKNSANSF
ncbi:MAG: hypothetical protein A2359_05020 [Candidatus Moranbacteria bacterium RIFOXYB1_FULL_43_19]|nr:MAG: hypothetical protein A2359_05020 [Candidatus Moranbacteria bacterium RIFOXYB1_FULL_43_19]OGI28810.1 MAG: hypothetical protein A2184_01620 [Candidatus Moranbacteria bacterium RIFOXYA1_FULL_44_7]OGI33614.1 MAG: hypothetical protein A2420_00650 [Candidatus Moranbacteria bacterium RIFOXYC1_FULL_44_13]OGI37158.1 MAG: hypothetical protein A2612_00190 [Candidatus Moranbacteria bacterium RIFOXYD1_FULL_44_12]